MNNVEEPWTSFGQEMENAWGQFMRTGSFPENTMKSYEELNFDAFNVLDGKKKILTILVGKL